MRRLLTDWFLSRWLDDGRPPPRAAVTRRRAGALADVDRALKSAAGTQVGLAPPFLRTRIVAGLDATAREPTRARQPLWAQVALSVACVGLLVGAVVLMKVTTPGTPPIRIVQTPLPRPELIDRLRTLQDQVLRDSIDNPLRQEARNLVLDTRRAADVVLTRFPFNAGGSR